MPRRFCSASMSIACVGTPMHVGRAGFDDPVERPMPAGGSFMTNLQPATSHCASATQAMWCESGVATEPRRRRRGASPAPSRGVGQQRVVRVHDAFRRAGRARCEGEIDDLVGIVVSAGVVERPRQRRGQAAGVVGRPERRAHRLQQRRRGRSCARRRPSPAARRGRAACRRLSSCRSRRTCSSGAATDCRRSRCASTRGTRRPLRRGSAARPRRDRRARGRREEVGGHGIDPELQRAPGQLLAAVAQRRIASAARARARQQRVERVAAATARRRDSSWPAPDRAA